MKTIFITGGTGYIGSRLIRKLVDRGHEVIALVRKGSEHKMAPGAKTIIADPFDARSFQDFVPPQSVFVQLLGVPHPSPKKKELFCKIDLESVKASAEAASFAGVAHFVYISVSMSPTKIMKDYQDVRREGELLLQARNFDCSFIRPWYVLGPGHWWPIVLLPFYGIAEIIPSIRQEARSKGLVTINQMIRILIRAIEADSQKLSVIEIPSIRKGSF